MCSIGMGMGVIGFFYYCQAFVCLFLFCLDRGQLVVIIGFFVGQSTLFSFMVVFVQIFFVIRGVFSSFGIVMVDYLLWVCFWGVEQRGVLGESVGQCSGGGAWAMRGSGLGSGVFSEFCFVGLVLVFVLVVQGFQLFQGFRGMRVVQQYYQKY